MILLIFLILFAGCLPRYSDAVADFRGQRFDAAEEKLRKADLPYTSSKDAVLFTLNRAMVRFVKGDIDASLRDFQTALDAIDYYSQFSAPELAAKTLLEDSVGAYRCPPFEIALARFYYALALLQKGDEDNAAAVLYYLENHDQATTLTSYLLALLLDRRGDASNAAILYKRAGAERGARALCIRHIGAAPYKISVMAPASIVSAAALEVILDQFKVRPALSTLTGVPVPQLQGIDVPVQTGPCLLQYDIGKAAEEQLDKDLPDIAVRAAARILLRRAAVASAKERHQPFADLGMLFANILTTADTRSWETLPSRIEIVEIDPPAAAKSLYIEHIFHP